MDQCIIFIFLNRLHFIIVNLVKDRILLGTDQFHNTLHSRISLDLITESVLNALSREYLGLYNVTTTFVLRKNTKFPRRIPLANYCILMPKCEHYLQPLEMN